MTHSQTVPSSNPPTSVDSGGFASKLQERDLLANCVHCGFCLEVCPTYKLTGDENNSPRGRLRLWRKEAEGSLDQDAWTDFYTSECIGCLACEPACPANVPYGEILEHVRREHVKTGRARPGLLIRWAAAAARRPGLFSLMLLPARILRRSGLLRHRFLFSGDPAVLESTASYTQRMMQRYKPTGPRVALLTGCLMESLFREINFATVRVLIENNVQVEIPAGQRCCGAFQEHTGLDGVDELRENNLRSFGSLKVDAILANASGCGLALGKTLKSADRDAPPVRDVLDFLGQIGPVARSPRDAATRVFVDLPCHLIHGQQVPGIAANVLDATGYQWELAPHASDCCGSGGSYHIQKPENAREVLARKAAFLQDVSADHVILATANHVCMMQWNSARSSGLGSRPFTVHHLIQLLDPGADLKVCRQ
jgi:glycolate oxidase iron-sulfur subunit